MLPLDRSLNHQGDLEPLVWLVRLDDSSRPDPKEARCPAVLAGDLVEEDAGVVGQPAGEAEARRDQVDELAGVSGRPVESDSLELLSRSEVVGQGSGQVVFGGAGDQGNSIALKLEV